jgi:hypothetical protein
MAIDKLNPNAPPELAQFAFLVGEWRCDVVIKQPDGSWGSLKATWEARFILDGYAIADEYRMTAPTGELLVLGVNIRSYDAKRKAWNMKWLNVLDGAWTGLGTEEMGGVKIDENGITFCVKEQTAAHALTRVTFANISANHFTWRGDRSDDGEAWDDFIVIEAHRSLHPSSVIL